MCDMNLVGSPFIVIFGMDVSSISRLPIEGYLSAEWDRLKGMKCWIIQKKNLRIILSLFSSKANQITG